MSETRDDFVISFKPHTGYDSPLIAVKGSSVAEIADKVQAAEAAGLFAIIGRADASLKAQYEAGKSLDAVPVTSPAASEQAYYGGQQAPAPQAQPAAPAAPAAPAPQAPAGVETKTCQHGTKVYRTAPPNAPKQWGGWFCPARKGDPSQCSPEWDNDYGKRR